MNYSESGISRRQPAKKSGIITFFLLFVAIIGIAAFVYLKSQGLDLANISIKEYIGNLAEGRNKEKEARVHRIEYDPKEYAIFGIYKDLIIKCTGDHISAINKKGDEQWKIPAMMSKPVIKSTGADLLVADIGGRNIYVINGRKIKWETKTDGSIINASLSESGHVAVVQEARGYKARIRVYDPNGTEIFYRNIAENFIISAQVSPGGSEVLINELDISGVNVTSALEFTDILGNPFAAKIPKQDNVLPYISYLRNGSSVAAGDSLVMYLDSDRNQKWEKEYDRVYSVAILNNKFVAVASGDRREGFGSSTSQIDIFNTSGHRTGKYTLNGSIIDFRAYSDILGIATGREVHFINSRGKLLGEFIPKADILQVLFFNKLEVAVVTKANISIINIGG